MDTPVPLVPYNESEGEGDTEVVVSTLNALKDFEVDKNLYPPLTYINMNFIVMMLISLRVHNPYIF